MILGNLQQLHASMLAQGMTTTRFQFHFEHLAFSVIYIADGAFPHELLIGCQTHNIFIVTPVLKGYKISSYLGDAYGPLLTALGVTPNPDNRFKPEVFFQALDLATPTSTIPANRPTPRDIAQLSRDVEDADKIYFLCWRTHDGRTSKPSAQNLTKTKRICGTAFHDRCKKYHISSCWTDDPLQENPITTP